MPATGKVTGGKKLEALMRRLRRVARGTKAVTIGVQGREEGVPHPGRSRLSLASILAIHEFGAPSKNIPERAPLRTAAARCKKKWVATLARGIRALNRGEVTEDQMLGLLGERALADTKITMRTGLPPPLAPRTIRNIQGARRKDPTALIDTETLFKSLSWATRVRGKVKTQGGQDA